MCGRMNVSDHPGIRQLMKDLGIPVYPEPNSDLRPTQLLLALTGPDPSDYETMQWGIKPTWSKSLLINAKSETVSEKKTFSGAFRERRCLIPCSGWYEWKDEGGPKKQKYAFTHVNQGAFLMAGIWFNHDGHNQVVTLTTAPQGQCKEIHARMPVIIQPQDLNFWFNGTDNELTPLMSSHAEDSILIEKTF
jgi:putative SOS response-associated peptidase YedK